MTLPELLLSFIAAQTAEGAWRRRRGEAQGHFGVGLARPRALKDSALARV